ncbi:hypothetical protein RN001_012636 [Aquatica leii]|uniref:Uncharacterized protein n=1 Tax=Aquatica leii TaxID=1421715 RepID=A0AAN7PT35_9COLE|nr:hypothetical protein RN001_012636 [Aquatica leii]
MQSYLKDPYWKRTIDYIQSNFYCCGLTDYKTWYKIIWLDENQLKMDNPLVQELRLSETKPQFPVIPWSCCNIEYPLQCFHDPFQQPESSYLWKEEPLLIEQSIYNTGCLSILTRPVEKASKAFILITSCLFILMICSICTVRMLFTSCRNNIILQHESGIAPGWIFGRGDCGWAYGPPLDQIMTGILSKKVSPLNDQTKSPKSPKSSKSVKIKDHRKRSKIRTEKRKSSVSKKQAEKYKSDEEPVSSGEEKALMLQ